jgi:hypothetical protein
MTRAIYGMTLAAALCASACESGAPSGSSEIVAAWQSAGLKVSDLKKSDGKGVGKDCQEGKVSGLDVTLCTSRAPKKRC